MSGSGARLKKLSIKRGCSAKPHTKPSKLIIVLAFQLINVRCLAGPIGNVLETGSTLSRSLEGVDDEVSINVGDDIVKV